MLGLAGVCDDPCTEVVHFILSIRGGGDEPEQAAKRARTEANRAAAQAKRAEKRAAEQAADPAAEQAAEAEQGEFDELTGTQPVGISADANGSSHCGQMMHATYAVGSDGYDRRALQASWCPLWRIAR